MHLTSKQQRFVRSHNLSRVTAILASTFLSLSVAAQDALHWRTEDGGNGHWYRAVFASPSRTPEQWFAWATANGGYAATVTSAGEQAIVLSVAMQGETFTQAVIGGKRNGSNIFQWVTGEPWTYTGWSNGEPSCTCEDYLMLYPTGWNDTNQTARAWAIVEYAADCNGDGITDFGQIRAGELADNDIDSVPDCCEQGFPCIPCEGDISGNGTVDGVDLAALLVAWGTIGQGKFDTDLNNDGVVNGSDLTFILSGWGPCQ